MSRRANARLDQIHHDFISWMRDHLAWEGEVCDGSAAPSRAATLRGIIAGHPDFPGFREAYNRGDVSTVAAVRRGAQTEWGGER